MLRGREAAETRHPAIEREMPTFTFGDESAQRNWGVANVGISQKQILRIADCGLRAISRDM